MGFAANKIEQIATESLVPYARNARTHSEAQVAQIAGSIKEFGFTNPVLIDGDNGIVAGHGRVLAARISPRRGKRAAIAMAVCQSLRAAACFSVCNFVSIAQTLCPPTEKVQRIYARP